MVLVSQDVDTSTKPELAEHILRLVNSTSVVVNTLGLKSGPL